MMRAGRALLLLSCLLLASCLKVQNFGDYWDKGYIDPYLTGSWRLARDPSKGRVLVSDEDGEYNFIYSTHEKFTAKVLKLGHYHFLMLKEKTHSELISGFIVRYKIRDGRLVVYEFDKTALALFLKDKYPAAAGFSDLIHDGDLTIKKFDDETAKILADIPDTPQYWHISDEYSPI